MAARALPSGDVFFDVGRGPQPGDETPSEWLAYADTHGHFCCFCPLQDPPMPCCNERHSEAVERFRQVHAMED